MNSSGARACLDGYIADQTVVYVPIWRQTNDRGGSNLEYEVTGVAAFVLTSYDRHAVTVSGQLRGVLFVPERARRIRCSSLHHDNGSHL